MSVVHKMDRKEIRSFRKALKPYLEQGLTHVEIVAQMNKDGYRMPDGRPVHRSTVSRHACHVQRRQRIAKRAGRQAEKRIPTSGRLGLVSEILTMPGLSEAKRMLMIRTLVGE